MSRFTPTQSAQIALYQKLYGATLYHEDEFCKIYFYNSPSSHDAPAAFAFQGKSYKPVYHEVYPDFRGTVGTDRRKKRADDYIASLKQYKEDIKSRRVSVNAADYFSVGDILHYSWGYDQTNCEFYQVIGVKAKSVVIQEIGSKTVKDSEGPMSCSLLPNPDHFLSPRFEGDEQGKPLTKLVKVYDGNAHLSMEFGSATLWDGKPEYSSWYA